MGGEAGRRPLCWSRRDGGAREGAVEEERWGYWVVSALPVGYPRCTGAHPTDGLPGTHKGSAEGSVWPEHPSQQANRQVEVRFLTCRSLPGVRGLR